MDVNFLPGIIVIVSLSGISNKSTALALELDSGAAWLREDDARRGSIVEFTSAFSPKVARFWAGDFLGFLHHRG